jgi:predicted ATPase
MNHENRICNEHFFILTGGPGVGKTTVLDALQHSGWTCIPEAARPIIQNQQAQNGEALPWKNKEQYTNQMLCKSVKDYKKAFRGKKEITFFDRGIPDTLAYADLEDLTIPDDLRFYSQHYRYNTSVFLFPPWREVYRTDDQRKQSFEEVISTHQIMVQTYRSCGYTPIVVPRTTVQERCNFILDYITHLDINYST